MPLDDLVGVIETLKGRIASHRDVVAANEYRTRVSLIDPLLCALGWDTANPSLVTLEYDVNGKKADYALLDSSGKPTVFLEAKRLGESLVNHRSQMALYASELGIRYPALTNGDRWEVYDNSKMVPIEERCILDVSIGRDNPAKLALKLLLLWRANVASSSPQIAEKPIVEVTPSYLSERMAQVPSISDGTEKSNSLHQASSVRTPESQNYRERLGAFSVAKGAKRPSAITFENGEEKPIKYWKDILKEVAEHLIRNRQLKASACPVLTGRNASNYLIDVQSRHPNGRQFHAPAMLTNGLYLETAFNSGNTIGATKHLLEHFHEDPSRVWLKMG